MCPLFLGITKETLSRIISGTLIYEIIKPTQMSGFLFGGPLGPNFELFSEN